MYGLELITRDYTKNNYIMPISVSGYFHKILLWCIPNSYTSCRFTVYKHVALNCTSVFGILELKINYYFSKLLENLIKNYKIVK